MIMAVQRKWMYLESIFVGSEDIRKQLPSESSLFDRVNADWISTTKRMQAAGTAYKAAHLDGALELLVQMDDTLDRIQESLDEYLETKRQAFPRCAHAASLGPPWTCVFTFPPCAHQSLPRWIPCV